MDRPTNKEKQKIHPVMVRLREQDAKALKYLAKLEGLSLSAYARNILSNHLAKENADASISYTEKIVRETLENILDLRGKKEEKLLRKLIDEVQRSNMMQLKTYIERKPNLDSSEYRAFYYQSDKEAYELSSGKRTFTDILESTKNNQSVEDQPDWLKILTGEGED